MFLFQRTLNRIKLYRFRNEWGELVQVPLLHRRTPTPTDRELIEQLHSTVIERRSHE